MCLSDLMCLSEKQWDEIIGSLHGTYTLQPDQGDGVTRYTVTPPAICPVVKTAEEAFALWSKGTGVGIDGPAEETVRFQEMVRQALAKR